MLRNKYIIFHQNRWPIRKWNFWHKKSKYLKIHFSCKKNNNKRLHYLKMSKNVLVARVQNATIFPENFKRRTFNKLNSNNDTFNRVFTLEKKVTRYWSIVHQRNICRITCTINSSLV